MAKARLFKTAEEIITGYDLEGSHKRGERNVWLKGRKLRTGNVALVKVLPHCVNGKGKRSGEVVSTRAVLVPEKNESIKRMNEEKVKLWRMKVDQENIDREREGTGFTPEVKSKKSLLDFIRYVGDEALKATGNKHSVYATMNSLAKHVEIFAGSGTKFEDLSTEWVRRFIAYLKYDALNINYTRTEKTDKRQERHLSNNSQNRLIRNINFVLNKAVECNYLSKNPMDGISSNEKVKQESGTREYLTDDEVQLLMKTPFTHGRFNIRESFLFACFTGLRFSDLKKLKMSDFYKDKNGTKLTIEMQKTKKKLPIYVPEVALSLLPKVEDKNNPIFYLPKNDYANESLRKWVKDAGISGKLVTFHVARHTSATLLLSYGVPIAAIQRQLGHTKASTTEIYAELMDKSQYEAASVLDKKFKKKKGNK